MSYILNIETATKNCSVAISKDGKTIICNEIAEEGYSHAERLHVFIESCVVEAGINFKDLVAIAVSQGPGSYTGLRIGVVVAKMFGWNNNIPVKTISSLALMASSVNRDTAILSEIDARRGNSFLGLFTLKNGELYVADEEQLTNLEEYKATIETEYEVVSIGEPNMEIILNSDLLTLVEDIHSLNPNYLRLTEAERNLK